MVNQRRLWEGDTGGFYSCDFVNMDSLTNNHTNSKSTLTTISQDQEPRASRDGNGGDDG